MRNNRIFNLTAGTVDADGVNVSQLKSVISGFGGGASFNTTTGLMTPPSYTINGTAYGDVGQAIAALDGGWNLQANGGAATAVTVGDAVNFKNGDNILITQSGRELTLATSMTPSFTTVTTTGAITAGDMINANGGLTVASGQTVSMGNNKITNVAVGTVSSTSTDAINGSQLSGLASSTAAALGGGSTVNSDGSVSAPSYIIGSTSFTNIGGAISAINSSLSGGGIMYFHANSALADSTVTGTDSVAIGPVANATGNNSVALGANSIADADDTVSVGSSTAQRKIVNMAAGLVNSTSTDAVNGSQLYGLGDNVASALGGGASYANGTWTGPSYALSSGTFTSVGGALANIDGRVVTNTTDIANLSSQISSGTIGLVQQAAPGDKLTVGKDTDGTEVDFADMNGNTRKLTNVTDGAVSSTSTDAVNGSQLYDLADSVSIAIGGGMTVNQDGTVTQPSFTVAGSTVNSVGEAIDSLNTYVTGGAVPVKYLHVNSTQADSTAGGQESIAIGGAAQSSGTNSIAMGANASSSAGGSVAIGSGAQASQTGSVALGEGSVANRPVTPSSGALPVGGNSGVSIAYNTTDRTLAGAVSVGSDNTYRQITNVADGQNDFDAVNVRQLRSGLESTVAYVDDRVTALQQQFMAGNLQTLYRINRVENRLSGGIAAVAAMGAIPFIDPGKTYVGASVAGYNGQGGFGAVIAHRSEDGAMVVHAGVGLATGGSKPVGRIGVGYQF